MPDTGLPLDILAPRSRRRAPSAALNLLGIVVLLGAFPVAADLASGESAIIARYDDARTTARSTLRSLTESTTAIIEHAGDALAVAAREASAVPSRAASADSAHLAAASAPGTTLWSRLWCAITTCPEESPTWTQPAEPQESQTTDFQDVNPAARAAPAASAALAVPAPLASDHATISQNVKPAPAPPPAVPERIVERVIEPQYIVSSDTGMFTTMLDALEQRIRAMVDARFAAQPAPQPAFSGGGSAAPAFSGTYGLTQKIDTLTNTTLTNPTITGGSLSGVSVGAGDLSGVVGIDNGGTGTSTTPTYGQVLLGNASGAYDLVATSSLGITGGGGGASFGQAFELAGGALSPTTSVGLIVSASSTFAGGLTTGNATMTSATTTNFFSTLARFTTGLVTSLSGTDLTYTRATIESATTTRLDALQYVAVGQTSTTTIRGDGSASSFAGGITAYASSTIGAGGQATGLTISGGATTTGNLAVTGVGNSYFSGNVGIGTTSPASPLTIQSSTLRSGSWHSAIEIPSTGAGNYPSLLFSGQSTDGYGAIAWSTDYSGTSGNTVIGDMGFFQTSATNANFYIDTNNAIGTGNPFTSFTITGSGSTGIGTSTPWAKLSVTNTGSGPSFVVEDGASPDSTPFIVDSSGNVGIGTTTPQWLLNPTSASAAQLSLSAGAGVAQWAFRNAGGDLFLATTTVAGTATTSTSALTISGSGFGTTTVSGLNINGQATSTSNVGFNITTGCFAVNGVCVGSGSSFGYPFALSGNATSTLTQFNAGLTAYASSTIGNGTAAGGLTVSGTATATNAVITSITSSLLKTNALGQVTAAVAGTDYALPSSSFGKAWELGTNIFGQSALAPTTTQNIVVSGTGTSTFSGGLEAWRQIAAPFFHATSTSATSTFSGNVQVDGQLKVGTGSIYLTGNATSTFSAGIQAATLNITGATSTFANGINLTSGCFAIGSTCIAQTATATAAVALLGNDSSGTNFSIFQTGDGQVFTVGSNAEGRLGVGFTTGEESRAVPAPVPLPPGKVASTTIAFATGAYVITTDGEVYAWGYNGYGQLGVGDTTNRSIPTKISSLSNVVKLVTSDKFTTSSSPPSTACALTSSGSLYCWGYNGYGQVGDYTTTTRNAPVQVATTSGTIADVAMADGQYARVCAVNTSGSLYCWGYNGYGQVGDYTTTNRNAPVQVATTTPNISQIALGGNGRYGISCFITTSGSAYCWGYNASYGLVGDYTTTNRSAPVQIATSTGPVAWIKHGTGYYGPVCYYTTSGSLYCWGYNGYGQVGDYTTTSKTGPVQVATSTGSLQTVIFAGDTSVSTTCALTTVGAVYCWGYNGNGQLGVGNTSAAIYGPVTPVQGLTNIAQVGSGFSESGGGQYHICARGSNGVAKCWGGDNSYGQLGIGMGVNSSVVGYVKNYTPLAVPIYGPTVIAPINYWNKAGTILSYAAGLVGIGTTTPTNKLTITDSAGAQLSLSAGAGVAQWAFRNAGGDLFLATTTVAGTATTSTSALTIIGSSGNVGIGTTSPWRSLSVTGTVGFDGLTGTTGAGSLCLDSNKQVVYNAGSDACLSSTRATKHDILALSLPGIETIQELEPVSFVYNDGDGRIRYGFIAEDTAAIDDRLATHDAEGVVSGIDDRAVLSVVVKAIKELAQQIRDLATTVASFATRVTTREICVTDGAGDQAPVCVTKPQLAALLSQSATAGLADPSPAATSSATSSPPAASLVLNGNNPAEWPLNEPWSDNLGALFTNGAVTETIYSTSTIDVTTAGTTTIDYWAHVPDSNWLHATRTIIISPDSTAPETVAPSSSPSEPEPPPTVTEESPPPAPTEPLPDTIEVEATSFPPTN